MRQGFPDKFLKFSPDIKTDALNESFSVGTVSFLLSNDNKIIVKVEEFGNLCQVISVAC